MKSNNHTERILQKSLKYIKTFCLCVGKTYAIKSKVKFLSIIGYGNLYFLIIQWNALFKYLLTMIPYINTDITICQGHKHSIVQIAERKQKDNKIILKPL